MTLSSCVRPSRDFRCPPQRNPRDGGPMVPEPKLSLPHARLSTQKTEADQGGRPKRPCSGPKPGWIFGIGPYNGPREAMKKIIRCAWSEGDDLYRDYHDEEWGVPCLDDEKLFEFILLEGAQAG